MDRRPASPSGPRHSDALAFDLIAAKGREGELCGLTKFIWPHKSSAKEGLVRSSVVRRWGYACVVLGVSVLVVAILRLVELDWMRLPRS
jgi:hypothetical protein